jgi:hypothetical protein
MCIAFQGSKQKYKTRKHLQRTNCVLFVFSNIILPLAQSNMLATTFQMVLVIYVIFNAPPFPHQSHNYHESDGLSNPNKVRLTATLLQNIGFSQNI